MIFGIFSCVHRAFIYLLWRTVCLELGHLFSTPISKLIKYKIPWCWLPFHSIVSPLPCFWDTGSLYQSLTWNNCFVTKKLPVVLRNNPPIEEGSWRIPFGASLRVLPGAVWLHCSCNTVLEKYLVSFDFHIQVMCFGWNLSAFFYFFPKVKSNVCQELLWRVSWICVCAYLSTQLCLTLFNTMGCSPPGSSVHGIFQARIRERVVISYSRGSSRPRDQTHISCIGRQILYHWVTWEANLEIVAVVQSLHSVQLFATHGLQHARLPCPLLSPGVFLESCKFFF